jgi:hypothetical protein
VAEMDAGLQELAHRRGRHERTSCGLFLRNLPPSKPAPLSGRHRFDEIPVACDLRRPKSGGALRGKRRGRRGV